jgi:hypothetical protein
MGMVWAAGSPWAAPAGVGRRVGGRIGVARRCRQRRTCACSSAQLPLRRPAPQHQQLDQLILGHAIRQCLSGVGHVDLIFVTPEPSLCGARIPAALCPGSQHGFRNATVWCACHLALSRFIRADATRGGHGARASYQGKDRVMSRSMAEVQTRAFSFAPAPGPSVRQPSRIGSFGIARDNAPAREVRRHR